MPAMRFVMVFFWICSLDASFFERYGTTPRGSPNSPCSFMGGKFVVQHGDKKASLMALDQSQEHSIQFFKKDSGSKGQQKEKDIIELSKT